MVGIQNHSHLFNAMSGHTNNNPRDDTINNYSFLIFMNGDEYIR